MSTQEQILHLLTMKFKVFLAELPLLQLVPFTLIIDLSLSLFDVHVFSRISRALTDIFFFYFLAFSIFLIQMVCEGSDFFLDCFN